MGNRYELRTGKFGCYFYDTWNNESVSLQEVLDMMNGVVPLIDDEPITTENKKEVVCGVCNDTHMVHIEHEVMCTSCPSPCSKCRAGGTGPFCETTPCPCDCHKSKR